MHLAPYGLSPPPEIGPRGPPKSFLQAWGESRSRRTPATGALGVPPSLPLIVSSHLQPGSSADRCSAEEKARRGAPGNTGHRVALYRIPSPAGGGGEQDTPARKPRGRGRRIRPTSHSSAPGRGRPPGCPPGPQIPGNTTGSPTASGPLTWRAVSQNGDPPHSGGTPGPTSQRLADDPLLDVPGGAAVYRATAIAGSHSARSAGSAMPRGADQLQPPSSAPVAARDTPASWLHRGA
ncbi:hypothetical protein NDU88_002099 [Pleurodeles waltl]|uniref:Uncharacterized protein n=1 Tax=Pleurodeles waltl TaxID=8319 RepID=A0AAV7Q5L6_PLEWA|nr:hypothetical protein NDU88_002099 [Pleurodeles waltl]